MKRVLVIAGLAAALSIAGGCTDQRTHARAVFVLVDTSGTYVQELDKAQRVMDYLIGRLNPGDSLAVARVKSRSFSEKEILAKVTLGKDPLQVNAQKLAFQKQLGALREVAKGGSAYTDITGGVLQAADFLNETGAGQKTIVVFSDMQEELDRQTQRKDVPINLAGIQVVALNVTKLNTDNVDPKRYYGRLQWWEQRAKEAGASRWRVINDIEHLERIFQAG